MSSSTPPSDRGARSHPQPAVWITHVAIVLAAALVAVIFPTLLAARAVSLVLWAIFFVSIAVPMITLRRFTSAEMTAGYAVALAAAALMFWTALGNAPAQDVLMKSIAAVLFLISAVLFLDVRRRILASAK